MTNPESFKENFNILQKNAATLSRQDDVDIDQLVDIVQQSTQAYKNCKKRLENVRTALDAQLRSTSSQDSAPLEKSSKEVSDPLDDIPI